MDCQICSCGTTGSQDSKSKGCWNEEPYWDSKNETTIEVIFFPDFVSCIEGGMSFASRGKNSAFVKVETCPGLNWSASLEMHFWVTPKAITETYSNMNWFNSSPTHHPKIATETYDLNKEEQNKTKLGLNWT